jgi:Ca2+-transporting ATPase
MIKGLTQREANLLLKKDGFNELPSAKPKTFIDILLDIIKEPMISLLLVAAILYLFLGDKKEAFMLFLSIFGVIGISLYQENKSEKSLKVLSDLSSPRAVVIRDGKEKRIAGREVVVGDTLILVEGDRVPADARLIEAINLTVDESILSGESLAVEKDTNEKNRVFSGTMVVKGHGMAVVTATATETELGKIGKSLKSIEIAKTLLQKEINTLVKWLAITGVVLCLILAVVYIVSRGEIIEGILAGLTLAIGILPEEFPIVLILFMTMGAWRLAKHNVLSRRAATIETLGAATVLCVDKTGTLTENKMSIVKIFLESGEMLLNDFSLDTAVIKYGILASQKKPFDPMETAFIEEGKKLFKLDRLYDEFRLVKEYPVEHTSLSVAHVYEVKNDGYIVALKGAPETVLDLCHLENKEAKRILKEASDFAKDGLRVIAVAKGSYGKKNLPEDRHEIEYNFCGLVGLADPVREGVDDSVKLAHDAGIRIIMITGDYFETALNIAKQIGLKSKDVVSGHEFEKMTAKQRKEVLKDISIFCRVTPQQKLIIVETLKGLGEVVAMTGDGVNDAPALKAAHIGVAMGLRGTDVAREASSIVLLDDNFNSIVNGVRIGRRIYDNLQKTINYLITIHIPIVIMSIVPVMLGMPLILLPAHIVFLEFIIDPTCTMVFESDTEDADIMKRPPRRLKDKIVTKVNLSRPLIQGVIIGAIMIIAYTYLLPLSENMARTFVFILFVSINVVLILTNLSKKESIYMKLVKNDNRAFAIVVLFTFFIMYLALQIPVLGEIFKFGQLKSYQYLYILLISLSLLAVFESGKLFLRKFSRL